MAELQRRRAECLALAANESDLDIKGSLLARAASLGADIREARRRKAIMPRALRVAGLKKPDKQDALLHEAVGLRCDVG